MTNGRAGTDEAEKNVGDKEFKKLDLFNKKKILLAIAKQIGVSNSCKKQSSFVLCIGNIKYSQRQ